MCGISGFTGKNPETIQKMNTVITHRGPDYSGFFVDESISLGHTLLSIRGELTPSKQPYSKNDSPWVLVYNGQLYNSKQLKSELGFKYENEELDTALLFGMIEKYGWNFIEKIHGMFAIALYNKKEKVLRLYRDPTGQKLLYYYQKDGDLVFGSEIKNILAYGIDKSVDEEAVSIATTIGYIPGNKTLFKYIKKLNISEELTFNLREKSTNSRIYESRSEGYYENKQDVFHSLVEEHMQSKKKVALNLSGGLDSSLLLHEMKKLGGEMHTYTNFFENSEDKYNTDAILARKLAKDYGTDHTEILITKEIFYNNFIDSLRIIEEPNYNISLPTYLETAKREGVNGDKNRVVLSGDGGDEVFGGYPYYLLNKKMDTQMRFLTPALFNLIKNKRNNTNLDYRNIGERWSFFRSFYTKYELNESNFNVTDYIKETAEPFINTYRIKKDSIYETMLLDRICWLSGENFIRSDKLYMSESLEMRSPLSYHPFRMHFDKTLKKNDYMNKNSNKIFLRNYYKNKLPDYIVDRKDKTGWRAPIEVWYDKKFKDLFIQIIESVEKNQNIIDWKAIKAHIQKTDKWPGKYMHLYLSLAVLSKEYNLDI